MYAFPISQKADYVGPDEKEEAKQASCWLRVDTSEHLEKRVIKLLLG